MRSIVVGTAGHIDHGKSALVRALTGTDPDRLKEEQARGITIDLGFAHCTIDGLNVAFVDVPGHERFVKNMLAGAGGIDSVMLVVAADESVMPQTREHFAICRLLQVPSGLIALTKADLVDAETLELVRLEVRELVEGSFLGEAAIVPVSSRTGEGLPAIRDALQRMVRHVPDRLADGAARLPVDRVFSMRGFGTVVTGTLVSGRIRVDEELSLLPGDRRVKVRGIQVHGQTRPVVTAGHRAAINLGGIEVSEIIRGQSLVTPGGFESTRVLDAVIEVLTGARPLRHGARVRFHQGTSEVLGRIAVAGPARRHARGGGASASHLAADRDVARGASGVAEVEPGTSAYARVRLESPAVLTRGDRFILRAYSPSITIAGGQVLDPRPPRAGIRTPAGRSRFELLDPLASSGDSALVWMLRESGSAGLPAGDLTSRLGLTPSAAVEAIGRLADRGHMSLDGLVVLDRTVLESLTRGLLAFLEDYHRAQPLSDGVPREEARARLFAHAHPALFERVLSHLTARGAVVARDRIALAGHRLELSPEEERLRERMEIVFREAGLKPPELSALLEHGAFTAPTVDRVAGLLVRQKVLVRLDALLFHQEALQQLKSEVAGMKTGAGTNPAELDVAAFKRRFGISRKYAIPLLEYLDRERLTRRIGDKRVVI